MSYNITPTLHFQREAKRLIKKFPSLKNELIELANSLVEEPKQGAALANNCYKIRLSIASKGKGKSGGARIITHFQISKNNIFLLSIYDKSERESLSEKEIENLLGGIIL